MGALFILTLGLSLAGGAICLLVAATGALVRNRLRSAWLYYLWLIVLLCFLIPVPLNLPFASSGIRDVYAAISSTMTEQSQPLVPVAAVGPAESSAPDKTIAPENGVATPVTDSAGHISAIAALLLRFLPYLWLAGAAALLLRTLASYALMLHRLRRGRTLQTPGRVPVYESSRIATPLLVGVLRPAVYLPAGFNNPALALRHELTHLRRGDIWLKWLIQLTVCVHWFNPLAWLTRRELNRLCELACDISSIRELDEADRRKYGAMLLDTAGAAADRGFMLVVALGRDKQILKERLREIMTLKKAPRKSVAAMTVLSVIILSAAVLFGALFSGCAGTREPATEDNGIVTIIGNTFVPSPSPYVLVTAPYRNTITVHTIEKIVDLPFDSDDPDVIGTWLPAGKADSISAFEPHDPPLSSAWALAITQDTQGFYGFYTQPGGLQEVRGFPSWDSAVSYEIKEIDGRTYLFIEELDKGDLTSYFVFEKKSDTVPSHNGTVYDMTSHFIVIYESVY